MAKVLFVLRVGLCLLLSLQLALPARVGAEQDQSLDSKKKALEQMKREVTLWVLAIGVSQYEESRLNLKYADNDALSIAQLLKTQQGVLFLKVVPKVLVNQQATRAEILMAMDSLNQAAQEDVVLIFLAGHGFQNLQTGTYYFVPYDANAQNLVQAGLPMSAFDEAIKRLRPNVNRLILWIDTCHAGSVLVGTPGLDKGQDLARALSQASGLYVLSACKAGEESLESDSLRFAGEKGGHGVFTYSLLKVLQGDVGDSMRVLSMRELFSRVDHEVRRITVGKQHSDMRSDTSNTTDLPIFASVPVVHEPPDKPDSLQSQPPQRRSYWNSHWKSIVVIGVAVIGIVLWMIVGPRPPSTIPGPPAHP